MSGKEFLRSLLGLVLFIAAIGFLPILVPIIVVFAVLCMFGFGIFLLIIPPKE